MFPQLRKRPGKILFVLSQTGVKYGKVVGLHQMDHEDRDIWFRLKHRILPTKDKLQKMGITNDKMCLLCKRSEETVEHIFLSCPKHLDAWIFAEGKLRKYNNDKYFVLNDSKRILRVGRGITDVALLLIGKLHRIIWNTNDAI